MIGDGLNDTPALKTADFGISITDDTSYFAPAGDAILKGESLPYLPEIIRFSKTAYKLLITSYVFSFVYNAIGLSLAFFGYLSPVVAAVFMPFSSISVVLFAVVSTNYVAKKYGIIAPKQQRNTERTIYNTNNNENTLRKEYEEIFN
jgi:Cu+-exporting ATPase